MLRPLFRVAGRRRKLVVAFGVVVANEQRSRQEAIRALYVFEKSTLPLQYSINLCAEPVSRVVRGRSNPHSPPVTRGGSAVVHVSPANQAVSGAVVTRRGRPGRCDRSEEGVRGVDGRQKSGRDAPSCGAEQKDGRDSYR
jgi:hypothetical protein